MRVLMKDGETPAAIRNRKQVFINSIVWVISVPSVALGKVLTD